MIDHNFLLSLIKCHIIDGITPLLFQFKNSNFIQIKLWSMKLLKQNRRYLNHTTGMEERRNHSKKYTSSRPMQNALNAASNCNIKCIWGLEGDIWSFNGVHVESYHSLKLLSKYLNSIPANVHKNAPNDYGELQIKILWLSIFESCRYMGNIIHDFLKISSKS